MPKGKGARPSRLGRAIETDVAFLEEGRPEAEGSNVSTDKGNSVNTENGKSVNLDGDVEPSLVSLTIKVPRSYRQHWQIEAKRLDRSVTSLIMDALQEKLGLPNR